MIPVTPVIPGSSIPHTDIASHQPEYITLPSVIGPYIDSYGVSISGCVVTNRWKLTWKERLQILFTGHIWHQSLTFGRPLQPINMYTSCPLKESDPDRSRT